MASNPVAVRSLTAEENEMLQAFKGEKKFKRYGSGGQILTSEYLARAEEINSMRLRHDDVIIHSFTKSGTEITQEIVWLLQNNLDYKTASENNPNSHYYFIESSTLFPRKKTSPDELPSPRFIKTHLHLELLPANLLQTCRLVHVARDPREATFAMYSDHNRLFKEFPFSGDFKSYWQLFVKDLVLFTPYFTSEKQAWDQRNHPNMLFLFHDEFVKDLPSVIKRIAKFLGKEYSEGDIKKLSDYASQFVEPNCSANSETGSTLCKGEEGTWRNHLDEESQLHAQEWMQQHLSDTDLRFPSM